MEVLKRPDELISPDPTYQSLLAYDRQAVAHGQPIPLDELHAAMARLELPESVPESVRGAFAVARNLWLYAWYHWPLHHVAGGEAYRCMEMALIARGDQDGVWAKENVRRGEASFSQLLTLAIDRLWIEDEGFQNFRRIQRGEHTYYLIPGTIRSPELYGPLDSGDARAYSKQLCVSLTIARSQRAHPERAFDSVPGWSALELEIAHDIARQLFSEENRAAD